MNSKTLISLLVLVALPATSAEPSPPGTDPKPAPVEKNAAPKAKPAVEPRGPEPTSMEPKEKVSPADKMMSLDAGTPPSPKKKK